MKVRKGGGKEILLIQCKEQLLCFAGAAMKRYPSPRCRCFKRASEGRHIETIVTEN